MGRSIELLAAGLLLLSPTGAGTADDLFLPPPRQADAVRALLVTGGHDHDISFYSVLEGQDDLWVQVDSHPGVFVSGVPAATDVVILYDMPSEMTADQRRSLRSFVEDGGGVVALHHAIAGRTGWRWWWEKVIGGRYLTEPDGGRPASTYKHDEELSVRITAEHPVTSGVEPFRILDETYKGMWISPDVEVLLSTDNPTSDGPVAWIGPFANARIVFIQLGHGREAHLHPAFRRLVRNATLWAAGRPVTPAGGTPGSCR